MNPNYGRYFHIKFSSSKEILVELLISTNELPISNFDFVENFEI